MQNILKMKKLFFILLLFIAGETLFAQEGVVFEHGTLNEALAKAKKNKKGPKLIFLDCYTTWCGPCKYMSNTIFPMKHVGDFFNANFVNIKIDMEKGEGPELAKRFSIRAYPTFLILDSEGKEINRIVGGGDADGFIKRVKKAMDPANTPDARLAVYQKDSTLENAVGYMEALNDSYMSDKLGTFFADLFDRLEAKDRYSEKVWPYLSEQLGDVNSKLFTKVLEQKSVADNLLSEDRVNKALTGGLLNYTYGFVSGRLKESDTTLIMNNISLLNFVASREQSTQSIVAVAKYYRDGKIGDIESILNVAKLMKLSEEDRYMVEQFVFAVKNVKGEVKANYLKSKAEFYKKEAEKFENGAKRFSDNK